MTRVISIFALLFLLTSVAVGQEVVYQDIDNDGVQEEAYNLDDNISNGYETYRDPNLNSQLYRRVDWDDDGVFELLIDTDLDNKPDVLWVPHTQVVYRLLRRNVDRDGSAEYEVLDTNKFFDVSDGKFATFCRLKGRVVSSKGEPLSFAKLTLRWEEDGSEITSWQTGDNGEFDVYITTLTLDEYCILTVRTEGYLTTERKIWIEHNKVYNYYFSLYPVVLSVDDVSIFPIPIKSGERLRLVTKSSERQKLIIHLLDSSGSYVSTLLDTEVPEGQSEFTLEMFYPLGNYYLVGNLGYTKIRKSLRITK
jgi:hypothetical protein